jgi:hypothetical protein
MTTVQRVAQILGIVFILVAIVGFFSPGGRSMDMNGMMLGMFPINLLHNCVHLLLGVWGVLAARSWAGAKQYATVTGVLYLLLAVVGFVSPNGFNLVPLGGSDIWLHAVLGIVLVYFGATAKNGATATA